METPDRLRRDAARRIRVLVPVAALLCAVFAATATQGAAAASSGLTVTNGAIASGSLRLGAVTTSSNWAGYAVTGLDATTASSTTFTSVSGRWVQPAVTCTTAGATYSAFWVGLGGLSDTSQALEQIGTQATCTAAGKAKYSMWYELVPAASVAIKFKVFPGNAIAASVKVNGTRVTLQIRNLSRRTNFTKTLHMAAPDLSSAEWIAEAPTGCNAAGCRQLPLANFGTVTFTRASATSGGHTGTISDVTWSSSSIDLVEPPSGPPTAATVASGALPSALSVDGASFAVTWQEALATPSPPIGMPG